MRRSAPFRPVLLLLALSACVPDYTSGGKGGADTGTGGGADDTAGSGDGGSEDTAGGEDGGDEGGDDGTGSSPDWIGTFTADYLILTPRGDTFCEGDLELVVDESGAISGATDCEVEEGPAAGDAVPMTVVARGADPTADETSVEGELILELRTGNGGTIDPAALTGAAGPAGISMSFELPIGRDGDAFPGTIETR